MQIFRKGADTLVRMVIASILVVPIVAVPVAYSVMASPHVTGQDITPDQPVPFSHKHHVGELGLDCRYCHTSVEKTRFAGLPPTETCMTCHSQLWTNAKMLEPVRASLADDQPIRWNRVNVLPDYVYFDHSVHVTNGVGCTECHGAVDTMPLMRQARPLTMGWCLGCHRDPAPRLRPRQAVFDPSWHPPRDRAALGKKLLAEYHIKIDHLTDCSICHR